MFFETLIQLINKQELIPLKTFLQEHPGQSLDVICETNNNSGFSPLMLACSRKSKEIVQALLDYDPNIDLDFQDESNEKTMSAIGWTIFSKNIDIAKLLLSRKPKPNLNIQNGNGMTPLISASETGLDEFVALFLQETPKPDLNIQDEDDYTALHRASAAGHPIIVGYLLKAGADPTIQNKKGGTAFHEACKYNHAEVVDVFLNNDFFRQFVKADLYSELKIACDLKHDKVVRLLLTQITHIDSPEFQDRDGTTLLMRFCSFGDEEIVKLVLIKKPNIDSQCHDRNTALMYAVPHSNIVRLLLTYQPNQYLQNNEGATALFFASQEGYDDTVALLLRHSEDPKSLVDFPTTNDITALMKACQKGHDKVVKNILEHSPQVDKKNKIGMTALHYASQEGWDEIVELLLNHHEDPKIFIDIQTAEGFTALMLACLYSRPKVVRKLLDKKADVEKCSVDAKNTALHLSASSGDIESVGMILDHTPAPQVDFPSATGHTAVFYAAQSNHHQVVERLLSANKSDINHQSTKGYSALMLACQEGHYETVVTIVKYQPRLDLQNNEGCSALFLATYNGYPRIVNLLLQQTTKPRLDLQPNNTSHTIFSVSAQKGNVEIFEILSLELMMFVQHHSALNHYDPEKIEFAKKQACYAYEIAREKLKTDHDTTNYFNITKLAFILWFKIHLRISLQKKRYDQKERAEEYEVLWLNKIQKVEKMLLKILGSPENVSFESRFKLILKKVSSPYFRRTTLVSLTISPKFFYPNLLKLLDENEDALSQVAVQESLEKSAEEWMLIERHIRKENLENRFFAIDAYNFSYIQRKMKMPDQVSLTTALYIAKADTCRNEIENLIEEISCLKEEFDKYLLIIKPKIKFFLEQDLDQAEKLILQLESFLRRIERANSALDHNLNILEKFRDQELEAIAKENRSKLSAQRKERKFQKKYEQDSECKAQEEKILQDQLEQERKRQQEIQNRKAEWQAKKQIATQQKNAIEQLKNQKTNKIFSPPVGSLTNRQKKKKEVNNNMDQILRKLPQLQMLTLNSSTQLFQRVSSLEIIQPLKTALTLNSNATPIPFKFYGLLGIIAEIMEHIKYTGFMSFALAQHCRNVLYHDPDSIFSNHLDLNVDIEALRQMSCLLLDEAHSTLQASQPRYFLNVGSSTTRMSLEDQKKSFWERFSKFSDKGEYQQGIALLKKLIDKKRENKILSKKVIIVEIAAFEETVESLMLLKPKDQNDLTKFALRFCYARLGTLTTELKIHYRKSYYPFREVLDEYIRMGIQIRHSQVSRDILPELILTPGADSIDLTRQKKFSTMEAVQSSSISKSKPSSSFALAKHFSTYGEDEKYNAELTNMATSPSNGRNFLPQLQSQWTTTTITDSNSSVPITTSTSSNGERESKKKIW